MTHSPVCLSLKDIGICYRRGFLKRNAFWALRNVSFDVHHGENLGVIGKNGSGKSTLLRLLSGIYEPDEGTIDHHGNTASLLSLQVGFIGHLNGRQNAVLSGMLLGQTKERMISLLPTIIEYSGLEESIDQPINTYSSGMRARLGFAVSYYADADILLVDEILGVGDSAFREKSADTMRERINSNKTVVLVSHSAQIIRSLCTRIVWIDDGKLKEVGGLDVVDRYEASQGR